MTLALAVMSPGCAPRAAAPLCTTVASCAAQDGTRVAVVGIYRVFPSYEAVAVADVPRAARLELEDGDGPDLDPYWSERARRSQAEIDRYLGQRVRVIGTYRKDMPKHPTDPPYASAMGGPCVEVESLELAL
ncbi:MAG: hypothetical protein IPM79_33630 [Polyangiaceae bacterium]|jgi:hypothetical protein|nr:hypothetical protein [Polyangiaceae bacterium]MBK8942407.1 hypothetical protein [Polyangiaceae bacterium]